MSEPEREPTLAEFHAHLRSLATTPKAKAFCEKLIAAGGNAVSDPIFVFGSNEAGRHGKGAALFARQQRGAVYGQGVGRQGNSYAIPTKGDDMRPLPLADIGRYVLAFLAYAGAHPQEVFEVTPIGCGLAGYQAADIAPMFVDAPANVLLPLSFIDALAVRRP